MNLPALFSRSTKSHQPRRVLCIRFHALGDTIILLPYLYSLRQRDPSLIIDLLTHKAVAQIPRATGVFDNVHAIGGGRNAKAILALALARLPALWARRYDTVIDFQNNVVSRPICAALLPRHSGKFDRFSLLPHGERARLALESVGFPAVALDTRVSVPPLEGERLLAQHHWNKKDQLIILNPAGSLPSRSWPIEHYIRFAELWRQNIDRDAKFVLLLLPWHAAKAARIAEALGTSCIDLTGKADAVTAYSIVRKATLVLSEDSGLMHMAWTQGVPTIALFSSSRKEWSAPQGRQSLCFDSSDMPCGPCSLSICAYGDNRCILRYSPEFILEKATALLYGKQDFGDKSAMN